MTDDPRINKPDLYAIDGIIRGWGFDDNGLYSELPFKNGTIQPPGEPQPTGSVVYIVPSFQLGASSQDPSLGAGNITAWYTVDVFTNAQRINMQIFLDVRGGSPGVGTGSYEVYLPPSIWPAYDWYKGDMNLWISGGGISEFDGSVKWTFRNQDKSPKLIFTTNGQEWSPTHPKKFADLKLRANITYYL